MISLFTDKNRWKLQTPESLFKPHTQKLNNIRKTVGISKEHWQQFYLSALHNYASIVQEIPASEAHHHAYKGGMLVHTLEVIEAALRIRQGQQLPPGEDSEIILEQQHIWTFAVFTGALLHDIGKPFSDQKIQLYSRWGRKIEWNIWGENYPKEARSYKVNYKNDRLYDLHEKLSLLLCHRVLVPESMEWLATNNEVLTHWLDHLIGKKNNFISPIVKEADKYSSATDLGGKNTQYKKMATSPQISTLRTTTSKTLPERMLMSLRYLIDHEELPLNRNGAAGWRKENYLYLVSKRTLDTIKSKMNTEGQTGIPGRNDRLMDELQQAKVIEVNDNKAIWKVKVFDESWTKAHELTVLKIACVNIWADEEKWPKEFSGSIDLVQPVSKEEKVEVLPLKPDKELNVDSTENLLLGNNEDRLSSETNSFDELPLPPFVTACEPEGSDDESTYERGQEENIQQNNEANEEPKEDIGLVFLNWLRTNIKSKKLFLNKPNSSVHKVKEGLILVSPKIFKAFDDESWQHVQKRFTKLKLNVRTDNGKNIHVYQISGERTEGKIKVFLISDIKQVFPNVDFPPNNPNLQKI